MIMEHLLGPFGITIGGVDSANGRRLDMLLPVRLVHTRVRDALDPHLFATMEYYLNDQIKTRIDALAKPARSNSITKLLLSPCGAARTRCLDVYIDRVESPHEMATTLENVCTVLENTGGSLRTLFMMQWRSDEIMESSLPEIRHITTFAQLRKVTLAGVNSVILLPYLLRDAPLLSTVTLHTRDEILGGFERALKTYSTSAEAVKDSARPMRAVKWLQIDGFGAEWLQAYLTVFKPRARVAIIYCSHIAYWGGETKEHTAALSHLAAYDGFEAITIRQEEGYKTVEFLKEGLVQREKLCHALAQLWEGKGMYVIRQVPKAGWQSKMAERIYEEYGSELEDDEEADFEPLDEEDYCSVAIKDGQEFVAVRGQQ